VHKGFEQPFDHGFLIERVKRTSVSECLRRQNDTSNAMADKFIEGSAQATR
jgi:hypothetical protein